MLERKNYRDVDRALPIMRGFIDRLNGYTRSRNVFRVYAIYCSSIGNVLSGNWKGGWLSEEVKATGSDAGV